MTRGLALMLGVLGACSAASHGEYTTRWASRDSVAWLKLSSGFTLRYVSDGDGPPLVLLHTIRTQLDYFEKIVPALSAHYRVYAIDLPGHGQSSIIDAEYGEPLYRQAVTELVEKLDLRDVTVVGESIGAVLALTVAAKLPDRVARVVAINPYDYGHKFGGGIRNGSASWIIGMFRAFPIETRAILSRVIRSGFHDGDQLDDRFLDELFATGKRARYRTMEYSLFANWRSWNDARDTYPLVKAPVTLVYGANDWSTLHDRDRTRGALGLDRVVTLPGAGHFASRERPDGVVAAILVEAAR
jgi:pimeloyl-ACP methyl ester carboxylesterase